MRIDKYDPKSGGFRAALRIDMPATPAGVGSIVGVALDANGRVVPCGHANQQSGFVGILVLTKAMKAGDIVDVMTDGEIVEFTGGAAGTTYAVTVATGAIVAQTVPVVATQIRVGHTVEAERLVVRVERAAVSQVP